MDLILLDEHVYDHDDGDDDDSNCDIEEGLVRLRHKGHVRSVEEKEKKLYVAVGKEVKESESLLLWAIQNSGGHTISVIHVHHPDEFIPILGKKYHWSSLEEQQVRAYRGIERQLMLKSLDEYLNICSQFGVQAEKLYIEMDSIENGLLQLIARHNIEKLAMGAAADDSYYTKMMEPKSKKAVYLQLHAPASCHVWFICKGHLIHQREGCSQMSVHAEDERPTNSKSLSMMGQSNRYRYSSQELLHREGASYSGPRSYSHMSRALTADPLEVQMGPYFEHNHPHHVSSPRSIAHAKSLESLYIEELRKRKELEDELEKIKKDRDMLKEELQIARNQNSALEGKVVNYDHVVKDLEMGMISNMELLQICEKEREDLKIERDNVLKTAEELLNQSADAASEIDDPRFFTTLTFVEIKEATEDFDPSLQLWEGESGSIYRGVLSHTQVTVKMWPHEGLRGPGEFHREVEVMSKFRHPNMVTLMGVCPEACTLVYEYLPNGSLEERLKRKDNTPPLSWKTRIRIATELCSALIFLHSQVPRRVVHGALKPASVLLDSNFTCKLSDFGFSRIIPHHENSVYTELSHSSEYMDPEFFMTGEYTTAVDVYSFGMIVLELLTGKPAFGVTDELEDALDENNFDSLLDATAGDWPFVQAEQFAKLALRCCAESASDRPDLESEVWRALEPMRASCGNSPLYHSRDEEHRQAPPYFMCPIFQEVMKDPHIAADGYTYEAEALRGWLESGHNTSPMTNLELEHCNLVPNHALRSAIQEWRQQH